MRLAYIYKITNTKNDKCYVGFTENPDLRWLEHQTCDHYDTMPLHKAIKDEGKEHFKFEILYKSSNIEHTLFVMEPYFIGVHNSHTSRWGYNVNYGGDHPYIKRDGYAILLVDPNSSVVDGEHYDDKPLLSQKKNSRTNNIELTKLLERIAIRDPDAFMKSVTHVLDVLQKNSNVAPFDPVKTTMTPISAIKPIKQPKTQDQRGLDLIMRIQNDGRSAIGKWYIAFGDSILCFRDKKMFIKQVETQMNMSATKLNSIAFAVNRSKTRLSMELLKKHHHRGVFVVYVEEHLLFDVPVSRKPRFNRHRKSKSIGVSYRKSSSNAV